MLFNLLVFLSTLPSRGATIMYILAALLTSISIHAPLAGSDERQVGSTRHFANFYPRSPRGERHGEPCLPYSPENFYPRSPRGERQRFKTSAPKTWDFYPRSPRGERLRRLIRIPRNHWISIHAPLAGSDVVQIVQCIPHTIFLSTLPSRGATHFSIPGLFHREFLSTLPSRGATSGGVLRIHGIIISIHAPLAGSDLGGHVKVPILPISIHAPLAGSDSKNK